MSITAESVVVEIIARLDKAEGDIKRLDTTFTQTTNSVNQSARAIEGALDRVGQTSTSSFAKVGVSARTAANDIDKSSARIANAQRNLGRQIADVGTQLSGGQSPFLIFAQQAPQVADALADTGGAASKVASFFAGPWGAAILAGGSILGILIEQLLSASTSMESLTKAAQADAEQSERTRQAKEAFTKSLEGQEIATRELNTEMKKEVETSREVEVQAYQEAQGHLAAELAARQRLLALQQLRRDQLQAARERADAPGANSDARALAIGPAQAALDQVDSQIAANTQAIADAEQRVARTQFKAMEGDAKRAADPIARINLLYDQQANAVLAAALANDKFTKSLERMNAAQRAQALAAERAKIQPKLDKIEADRAAALAAARNRPKKPDYGYGRDIDEAEARRIVTSIGGRVTSGTRSRESQARLYADLQAGRRTDPVAKPGTSAHERGKAIDVAFGPGITIASIREAFEKEGVRLKKIFAEPGQKVFHVDFSSGAKGKDPAVEAKRLADEKARNDRAFEDQRKSLNDELLRALGSQTQDATTLAKLALDQVNSESAAKTKRINIDEGLGRLTKDQAEEERILVARIAHAQAANIAAALAERIAKEKLQLAQSDARNQEDILSAQLELADTSKQRKAIEQKILDLKFEEMRLQEQANLDAAIRNKDKTGEKVARDRLATLPQLQGAAQQSLDRKYESPGQRYVRDLNTSAGELKNSFEDVAVNGLQSLNDQLADAIVNSKSLGDAFHNVALGIVQDLLKIAIQQAIIKPLANALFGGGAGGADSGGGGLFGSIVSGIGAIFGGGSQGNVPGVLSVAGARAAGGPVSAGSTYLVGERGPELLRMGSMGGSIIPNLVGSSNARVATPQAAQHVVVHVQANDYFDAKVASISAPIADNTSRQHLAAATPHIVRAAVRQSPEAVLRVQRLGTLK